MTAPASPLSCLLCGSTDAPPFLDVPEGRFSSRIGAFSVLRCSACGLARMTPFPDADDLAELYVEQGVFSAQRPNPNQGKVGFSTLEPLYSRYGAYYHFTAKSCVRSWRSGERRGPPRILDVGCSTGRLLEAFEGIAPEAELHGIDLDPRARERAPARLQPRIRTGAIEDLAEEEPFDIITLSFIIEHLLDFRPPLRQAVELLAPGGLLFVSTPDLGSAKARQQGAGWRLINDPTGPIGHVWWFDEDALRRLADSLGLSVESIARRGELLFHLPRWMQRGLRRALGTTDSPSGERFIRNYQLRMLWALTLDGVISEWAGYGDCMYGFFRKSD